MEVDVAVSVSFYVLLVFVSMCSVFLVDLVKLSLLAKSLARKTPLRKPNRGERSFPRPKKAYECCFIVFFHCLIA